MTRDDIAFDAEGCTLRGWLYRPAGRGPHPVVVMAHGYSAVKEQHLDRYAECFAAAGLAALVFDHRGFGASDGEPRGEIDPVAQIRDYQHAISHARQCPGLDGARIGAWGTSYSGGHVLVLAATDRRVRCVVSQVPTISGPVSASRRVRADQVAGLLRQLEADREARFRGAAPAMVAVTSPEPGAPCALPGEEAHAFFTGVAAPAWRNAVTLRSIEYARAYEPAPWVPRISPTPLLMIVAEEDWVTPTDLCLAAYNAALAPKRLLLLPGGHFAPYVERFAESAGAARDWFLTHLAGGGGHTES